MTTFMVRVAGWSNPRYVSLNREGVTLEVGLHGHCHTCDRRIDFVSRSRAGRVFVSGGSVFVTLPKPEGLAEDHASVAVHISNTLGLTVSPLSR